LIQYYTSGLNDSYDAFRLEWTCSTVGDLHLRFDRDVAEFFNESKEVKNK